MEIIEALISARINDASNFSSMKKANQELLSSNAALGTLAITDGLTGLHNHRYFMQRLNREFKHAQDSKSTFSLIFLDVDYFKRFNDSFGHVAGDQVLIKVGAILKNALRDTDIIARYGGEEFAIILPATNREGAAMIAERLRSDIAHAEWEYQHITISVGLSSFSPSDEHMKSLLESADKALYAAKAAGRNCVR